MSPKLVVWKIIRKIWCGDGTEFVIFEITKVERDLRWENNVKGMDDTGARAMKRASSLCNPLVTESRIKHVPGAAGSIIHLNWREGTIINLDWIIRGKSPLISTMNPGLPHFPLDFDQLAPVRMSVVWRTRFLTTEIIQRPRYLTLLSH